MTFTGATGILTLEFTSSSAADAPPSAVSILHASEPAQSIELHPDGLGRWRGEFDASAGGVFVAALPGRAIPGVTPPPRELIPEPGRGEGLLAQLAERSGGKQVDDGRDLLRHDFPPGVAPENISRELLLASLLLFVLDIAYRRLGPLSRFRRAPSVTAAPAATPAESSAVTALLDLRERRRPVALPSAPRASFTPLSAPSAPAKPLAPPPTAGHSAAKLLEAKRDRQRGREDRAPTSE